MTTAWRGTEEDWTNEERAAQILVRGLGLGSSWETDGSFSDRDPIGKYELRVVHPSRTLEQAGRAIHPDANRHPAWLKRLPPQQRAKVLEWNGSNPLKGASTRVREFKRWQTSRGFACMQHARSGADVAAALAIAKLPGPLRPLLLLYALQDEAQAETVHRYLCACGARSAVARDALVRLLFPARVPRGEAQPSIRMRASEYRKQLRETSARLERWLHEASGEFLRAYGVQRRPGTSSFLGNGLIGRDLSAATQSSPRRLAA